MVVTKSRVFIKVFCFTLGVPAAFVSINTVNRLCDLMISNHPQVRGSTAVALAFLSFNHAAERQLLNRSVLRSS